MPEPFDIETIEQLNAYLDGELEPAAILAFEERLARDPELRAFRNRLAAVDQQLKADLGEPPQTPPSPELMAALRNFSAAQTEKLPAETRNVVAFGGRKVNGGARNDGWRMAMAASIALCVGAGGMWLVQRQDLPVQSAEVALTGGIIARATTLNAALESTQSGTVLASGAENVRPILSFASKDGRFCREFEAFGAEGSVVGVACKGDKGWKMEVMVSAAPHMPDETQYAPASGFDAKAIDEVITRLIDGQSLSLDAEKKAQENGWRQRN
jgi:negative regulator of sigma E activity